MYNVHMSDKKVKFVFNQTAYYGGKKYQAGEYLEISEREAAEWENVNFGNLYKPRGSKKKKDKSWKL